ncbi:MAG: hypothetical protein EPN97_18865 [Alphaproteobacteria bacterium]|nr:MAG: hypothetical protein EPN97_18865 [Alphaproteobacteria bacterium]
MNLKHSARKGLQISVTGTALAVFFFAQSALAAKPVSLEELQSQVEKLSQQVEKLTGLVEKQGDVIAAQKSQIDAQKTALATQGEKVAQTAQELDKAAAKMAAVKPAAGGDEKPPVKITMSPMPKFESADGKYSFQPIGRFHMDITSFDEDKSSQPNNVNFRRSRLGFRGNLGEDFNYKAEVDFAEEKVNFKEVYLAYTGFDPTEIWLGNFKPPLGLEQNTSTNYMPFMELSPASKVFTRDESVGGALKTGGKEWSLAAGVFNEDAGNNDTTQDESISVDARASVDLWRDNPNVIHLGIGGSMRRIGAATTFKEETKPAGTGNNLVSTGTIARVDNSYVYGPEAAAVFGPFWAQGEYFRNHLDIAEAPDASFDGWYAQAGFFLTGETRPYKGKIGNFDRLKPLHPFSLKNGGWGAWEVLARFDELDLNDVAAGITGGRERDTTVGLNWYPIDNVRFMANYLWADTDDNAVTADDDPEIFMFRSQWDF